MDKKLSEILDRESWELKSLGEIAVDIYSGNGVAKVQLGTGNFPAIKCGDINSKLPIQFTECISFVDENLIKNKKYCEYGDILISGLAHNLETIGKASVYLGNQKCLIGERVLVIKHNQNPKYLAYVLSTEYCRRQIKNFIEKAIVIYFLVSQLKQIQIPLPSIETQNLIADYLDKFTEMNRQLEAELEMELKDRKIQYRHYRDELIIGRDEEEMKKRWRRDEEEMKKRWQIKTISEIATDIYSGNGVTKEQLGTGYFPSIRYSEVHKSNLFIDNFTSFVDENLIKNKKYCEYGDLLIVSVSEDLDNAGKACVYLGSQRCLVGNDIKVIKHNQNPKYLAYVLNTEYCRRQIRKFSKKGSTVVHLYSKEIKQIQIPLPTLEEQEEIVKKLDKFYDLVGNLEFGIPWLIKANRDQYEYYRNQIIRIY